MSHKKAGGNLDEIDRVILRIFSKDPRISYNSISDRLAEEGYEMSAEGIRHRVQGILDMTTAFFLFAPGEYDWEILRLGIDVVNKPDAKMKVREYLGDTGFWLICDGLGTVDIYAVATTLSIEDAESLVMKVREHGFVDETDFSIETNRITDIKNYFSHQ